MFSATLFVKHPTPAEPGTRLAAWPRPASTATTRASCRRCWPKPCPAQRCSRRECGGEWKAGHSACGWIYIFTYIYKYIYIRSEFWLVHTESHWFILGSKFYVVDSLCFSLLFVDLFVFEPYLGAWSHMTNQCRKMCVCVVWRHLLLDVDLWRMILLIHI